MPRPEITAPLCSLKGLTKTIQYDYYTYRWFLFLITHPAFRQDAQRFAELAEWFRSIQRYRVWQAGFNLVLFFSVIMLWVRPAWPPVILLAVALLVELGILSRKRACVAEISCFFIARDFPPEALAKTTLYQIGEIYSERYGVMSLVDAISQLDKIYQFSLVFIFFLVAYVTDIPQWHIKQSLFMVLFFTVVFLSNTNFLYRRYR